MMVKMLILVAISLFAGSNFVFGQDPQSFCKSYIQCSQDADKARQECDKLLVVSVPKDGKDSAKATKKASGDCASNVKNISDQLVQKQSEQRQQQRDCVNSRLGDAILVGKSRQEQCSKLAAAAGSGSKGGHRLKRKVAKDAPANATASAHASGNATAKDEKEVSKNQSAGTDYAAFAKCVHDAEVKADSCRQIAACCSETQTCEFEYKLSPLYHQIIQLQYDLFKQYRKCQKERHT